MSNIAAVIVAAGLSRRMGRLGDKIWIPLAGRPVLFYSLRAFCRAGITEIIVVTRPGDENRVRRYAHRVFPRSAITVVTGGADRHDSVWNGIESTRADFVLIHDAARPAVTIGLIRSVAKEAVKAGACVPASPVIDTIKRVNAGRVLRTVDRTDLFAIQTPQGFRRDVLRRAIATARKRKGRPGTDCAAMVEATGVTVSVVPGDAGNVKLTSNADLALLKAIAVSRRYERGGGG